jgi:hypothetical protein
MIRGTFSVCSDSVDGARGLDVRGLTRQAAFLQFFADRRIPADFLKEEKHPMMNRRLSSSSLPSASRLATWCVLAGVAALLLPLVALASDDIPRRADGKPDLSGTYDIATLTPMVRPREYGETLTLTEEEAKKIETYWKTTLAKDDVPSDPDREAPPVGGVEIYAKEFSGAAGGVGGYNSGFVDLGDSTFKIDGKYRTSIITQPANGQFPPLSKQGMERMKEGAAFRHANTGEAWWADMEVGPYDDPELRPLGERCLLGFGSTAGPPVMPVMYNNLKRIVQTDDRVMILNEMNHDVREIRIGGEHQPDTIRHWLGDSVGRWEGDTLVVTTKNFRDDTGFSMGTRDMVVTERFERVDADTLLYKFTVEDPTWTEPWGGEYPWPATEDRMFEYACHEGNYALGGILRGARILEQDAKDAKENSSDDD